MRQTRPTCTTRRQCVTAIHDCVIHAAHALFFSFLSHKLSSPSAATMAASQERSTHARTKAMCIVRCVIISRRLPAMFVSHLPPPRSSSLPDGGRTDIVGTVDAHRREGERIDRSTSTARDRERHACAAAAKNPSPPAVRLRRRIAPASASAANPQRRSVGSTTELLRVR